MTTSPAARAGNVPAPAVRDPSATRGNARVERQAFDRALARHAGHAAAADAIGAGHGAGQGAGLGAGSADAVARLAPIGRDSDDSAEDTAEQRREGPAQCDAHCEADSTATALQADAPAPFGDPHEGGDDPRRRWLEGVLAALDAAAEPSATHVRPREGLNVDTVVPGLGSVRLHLTWNDGRLRVSLRCLAAANVPNIAGNPHTELLRRALATRTPPVVLDMAGSAATAPRFVSTAA